MSGRSVGDERRDFVMFFEQKEGTTAIVRTLKRFRGVSMVNAEGMLEPFNPHASGSMDAGQVAECLDLIFSRASIEEVNRVYRRTSARSLSRFPERACLGCKMRFKSLTDPQPVIEVLRAHDVLVFLAVRQNLLRWALSKYHGDGTGGRGHLQFKLASGQLQRSEIPRIHVDVDAFERIVESCARAHAEKRNLAAGLREAGLEVVPVRYEDFLGDKESFCRDVMAHLGKAVTDAEISAALSRDIHLERVHGDDLSEFFINAEELEARFGDRYEAWP